MKPRILFVDHAAVLSGAELSLLDIARHFRGTSRVVLFEDGPFRRRLEAEDIPVRVLTAPAAVTNVTREGGLWGDVKAVPGVLRLAWQLAAEARAFDVLHANSQKAMVVAALAGALAQRPVVWHLRDLMNASHFGTLHRVATTRVANALLSRVVANSQATRQAFVENGGSSAKAHVVYNGIREEAFAHTGDDEPDPQGPERQALGLADDAPVIGVFGRLAEWKGQHVLLEALRDVPRAQALVVGAPLFDDDRPYEQKLRACAERLGLEERVRFLGFRDDVPRLMQVCDAIAHTSVAAEPFGRVVVEGMMASRPVVATRAGGPQEIIEHGVTGLLVPPGDSEALAATLRELLAQPERAQALAAAGRRAAEQRFSVEAMLEAMEQQFSEITR